MQRPQQLQLHQQQSTSSTAAAATPADTLTEAQKLEQKLLESGYVRDPVTGKVFHVTADSSGVSFLPI